MRWQRHPRAAPRPASAEHGQQHLYSEPVPAIGLEDLEAGVVVELLAGQRVRDVSTDVIVADAPRIRIAVCSLSHFRRRPCPNAWKAAQRSIGLLVRPRQGALQRSSPTCGPDKRAAPPLLNSGGEESPARDLGPRLGLGWQIHAVRRRPWLARRTRVPARRTREPAAATLERPPCR